MLGESFIFMLNYREQAICSPDIKLASFSPSADCVPGSYTLAQVKGSNAKPVQKPSKSKGPHQRPDPFMSNHDEKPYVSLSQPDQSTTILGNLSPFPQLTSITESKQVYPHSPKPQEWHISDMINFSQELQPIPPSVPLKQDDIPDDGYLVMDSSITLNGEPPTNSMLNGYLDKKLQEVYSQYIQERLAYPGSSPGCSLLSPFHQTSLLQLSQPLNIDSSLEPETRQSQGAISQRASSNFSSPVLRISNTEESIRPRH
ncbi:uncharacterized protein LOC124386180 [Silurus meridionalis]|uniref:Uncharacterized protein n=1 Tax=Silurus meridionalis TaxID=175797 RepID=A0A8T0BIX8_SILME|nr:uncharacterized protein LOC124386180 [Silurus meridionalis]KAF7707181.1 hypothetical protein HF521_018399 [Silurus meridionalis]